MIQTQVFSSHGYFYLDKQYMNFVTIKINLLKKIQHLSLGVSINNTSSSNLPMMILKIHIILDMIILFTKIHIYIYHHYKI